MSYHLLHLVNPNSYLSKRRGLIHCQQGERTMQMPIEDIRGVIIATKSITLSDSLIVALLDNGAFILHCDDSYQPLGITEPLAKIVNRDLLYKQVYCSDSLRQAIWTKLLYAKINAQSRQLQLLDLDNSYLQQQLQTASPNESICARYYWRRYFTAMGYAKLRRRSDDQHQINAMLNYGYAVLAALVHRAIVASGMSPLFGIHHKPNFHNHPLVYDIVEPLRCFVDYSLWQMLQQQETELSMPIWTKSMQAMWQIKTKHKQGDLLFIDAIDKYVQSIAQAYTDKNSEKIWLPVV